MRLTQDVAGPPPATADPAPHQRRRVLAVGILMVLVSVLSTLALTAEPPADVALSRWARWSAALDPLDRLGWISDAGASAIVGAGGLLLIVALCAAVLLGWRCRALMAASLASLTVAIALGLALTLAGGRSAPRGPGSLGSYPNLPVLVLALLCVLVPLAAFVLASGRLWVRVAVSVPLALLTLVVAAAQVRAGQAWPLDVLGGALMGLGLGLGVRIAIESPARHRRCDEACPWRTAAAAHEDEPLEEVLESPALPAVATAGPAVRKDIHRVTLAWCAGLVVALAVLSITRGLPRSPESAVMGYGLEAPLNWGLTILLVLGVLLARRLHLTGAVLTGAAAALLGYAASVQYSPLVALAIAAVAFLPALLLWLEWHRRASVRAALAVAVTTSLVLSGVVAAAADTYATFWGPTHPESATAPPNSEVVTWMWSGGVTATSAQVRALLAEPADAVRLVLSPGRDLGEAPRRVGEPVKPDDVGVVALTASGLEPATRYTYALEVDGSVDRARTGTFQTFPVSGSQSSFTFALSGDASTGSNGTVFDTVREADPLFFLNMGDFFYGDVDRNQPSLFRAQLNSSLTAPAQAALYASTSIAYIWGDHDYGGNNADRTSPSRPAAHEVYRQYVPHFPLSGGPENAIHQAFTVGRVRFVMTDNRSDRDPSGVGDPRSMLGRQQREWLLAELAQFDRYAAVVWMNGDPWVDAADPSADTWAGFAAERRIIADALVSMGIDNLLMVSADAHMLAFDDGSHTNYSAATPSGGAGGFPLLQAAALDRRPSLKGGPYSGPVLPGSGQFATVAVADDGDAIGFTITGRTWTGAQLFRKDVTFAVQ